MDKLTLMRIQLLLLLTLCSFLGVRAKEIVENDGTDRPKRYPVQVDGLWGYINHEGKLVIPAKFQEIRMTISRRMPLAPEDIETRYAAYDRIPVKFEGHWGYIDSNGAEKVPFQNDSATHYSDGMGIVMRDGNIFVLDERGIAINRPDRIVLAQAHVFREGRLPVRTQGFWIYDEKTDAMQPSDKWGFLGQDGGIAIKPVYDAVLSFSGGVAPALKDGNWGYINKDGKLVIQFSYEKVDYFFSFVAKFVKDGKEGLINFGGTVLMEPKYEAVGRYVDGRIAFKDSGRWGFADRDGKIVVEPQFPEVRNYSMDKAGAAALNTGETQEKQPLLWGFIDKKGDWAVPAQYEEITSYSMLTKLTGLAAVKKNGKWGYLNLAGQLAIPLQFDEAQPFFEGLGRVRMGDAWGYINPAGEWVWKPSK